MKYSLPIIVLCLASTASLAAEKPCDELKSEITAKLEAKGVKNYALEIVASDKVGEAKVVGSCAGGTKKITCTKK